MNIQDEAYSEAMDEIERLKAQHEEMLLKHAREQNIALVSLETALKEIEQLKGLLKSCAMIFAKRIPVTSDFIDELQKAAQ